jgi:hypothetical protein
VTKTNLESDYVKKDAYTTAINKLTTDIETFTSGDNLDQIKA